MTCSDGTYGKQLGRSGLNTAIRFLTLSFKNKSMLAGPRTKIALLRGHRELRSRFQIHQNRGNLDADPDIAVG